LHPPWCGVSASVTPSDLSVMLTRRCGPTKVMFVVLGTRTCDLGCLTTAAVFCCLQRHLALVLLATVHHTKGFFIGLVDPDPGFAKIAPLKKCWMGRLL
jgi:hypothetical protein